MVNYHQFREKYWVYLRKKYGNYISYKKLQNKINKQWSIYIYNNTIMVDNNKNIRKKKISWKKNIKNVRVY